MYAYTPQEGRVRRHDRSHSRPIRPCLAIDYNGTVSLGLPSGNTDYGLGAGQVTYNINNHFEKTLRMFTPDIELGYRRHQQPGGSARAEELRRGGTDGALPGRDRRSTCRGI